MKRVSMIVAAAMAVGGLGLAAHAADTTGTGSNRAAAPTEATIRQAVVTMTADAMAPHDLRKLAFNFPADQMRRIMNSSTYSQDFGSELDSRIERIRTAWREKYHHDFDRAGLAAALNDQFATMQIPTSETNSVWVDIKADHNQPELKMSVVRDKGMWSVSIPHSLTAERLRANLLADLSDFEGKNAHWPQQESEAYRILAGHVALAVLDKPAAVAAESPGAPTAAAQPAAAHTVTASPVAASGVKASPQASATPSHPWWKFWQSW